MAVNPEVLYDWLADNGHDPELVEDGDEIIICCPICQDDRPRLYISTDNGAWICFHCHEQGSLHQLFLRAFGLSGHEAAVAQTGMYIRDNDYLSPDWEPRRSLPRRLPEPDPFVLTLPESFVRVPVGAPLDNPYIQYLLKRGVSPELAHSRNIGVATRGRYRDRIIVPVENDGHLYTFIARTMLTHCPTCKEELDECRCKPFRFPKVLTPTKANGAQPRLTLYNLDAVRLAKPRRVIVTEGVFDALRRPNEAVALMGSSASSTQVALLAGLARNSEIILALDADEAGYRGAIKVAEALLAELVEPKVALLPPGTDPGGLPAEEFERCLNEARPYVL